MCVYNLSYESKPKFIPSLSLSRDFSLPLPEIRSLYLFWQERVARTCKSERVRERDADYSLRNTKRRQQAMHKEQIWAFARKVSTQLEILPGTCVIFNKGKDFRQENCTCASAVFVFVPFFSVSDNMACMQHFRRQNRRFLFLSSFVD